MPPRAPGTKRSATSECRQVTPSIWLVQKPRRDARRRIDERLGSFDEAHHDRQGYLQCDLALHDPGDGAELFFDDLFPVAVFGRQDERRLLLVLSRQEARAAAHPALQIEPD